MFQYSPTDEERYFGKYPALVLENEPEKEDTEHVGEIEVQVPGILEEAPNGSGHRPIEVVARPCLPPGTFWVPERESWVWVEFAAGDINHPLWSGVWYPTDRPPKTFEDTKPTQPQKILRSKSGHLLQLDDTEGKEKLVIKTKGGHLIQLDDTEDGEKILIEATPHSTSITIDKDGLRIQCGKDIQLSDANNNVLTLDAEGITITGGGNTISMKDGGVEIQAPEVNVK